MNRSESNTVNKKEKFWIPHIKKWKTSGLSQNKYCKKNNLTLRRFSYWKSKIDKKSAKPIELVQVETTLVKHPAIPALDQASGLLKLKIKGIFEIEISDGFSQKTLGEVITVLGEYI